MQKSNLKMDREFTLQSAEKEAQFINGMMPRNHSVQISQKYERRRKAEKKLDDMYVAEFSLRPVKRIKKESQNISQKNVKPRIHENKQMIQENLKIKNQEERLKPYQTKIQDQGATNYQNTQNSKNQPLKQLDQVQQIQSRSNRSQRVSKPTQAYIKFQQETFKRKIIQKVQQKMPQKIEEEIEKKMIPSQKLPKRSPVNIQPSLQRQIAPTQNMVGQKKVLQIPAAKQKQKQSPKQKLHRQGGEPVKKESFLINQAQKVEKPVINEPKVIQAEAIQHIMPSVKKQKLVIDPKQILVNKKRRQNQAQNRFATTSQIQQQQASLGRCWRILQKLKINKFSWPFRRPVDPIRQGVPDYLQVIKHPMNLRTIQKKLRSQKYTSQVQFYSDVDLMFQNSYTYNPSSSKYYKLTQELQKLFKELKSKSKIPQLTGKGSDGYKDQQQDQYNEMEEIQADRELKNIQEKQDNQRGMSNQKSENSSRKRNTPKIEAGIGNIGRSLSKILVTSEGPMRKDVINVEDQRKFATQKMNDNQNDQQTIKIDVDTLIKKNKPILQNKQKDVPKSAKKQVKQPQKKKTCQDISKNNQQDKVVQQKQIQNSNEKGLPFGYFQPKIMIMQRQVLLYDILNLKSIQNQVQIQKFLQQNDKIFRKFKQYSIKQSNRQNQSSNNQDQQSSQYYDFELKDLDLQSYQLLRNQVNRLIKIQEQNIKVNDNKNQVMQGQNHLTQ